MSKKIGRFFIVLCLSLYLLHCSFATTEGTPVKQIMYRTPVGSPEPRAKVQPLQDCTPIFRKDRDQSTEVIPNFFGSLEEVISDFFKDSNLTVSFEKNSEHISGQNHLATGIVTGIFNSKQFNLFVIQRRYEDYKENPPVLPCDLKQKSFADALSNMDSVMQKTGIVPLFDRLIQGDERGRYYVEFYPLVEAPNGEEVFSKLIKEERNRAELMDIVHHMGKQTAKMHQMRILHADCHLANFLVRPEDNDVLAIDCRGPLRRLQKEETPPGILFLEMLAAQISKTFKEKEHPVDCFSIFRNSYLKGISEAVPQEQSKEGLKWIFADLFGINFLDLSFESGASDETFTNDLIKKVEGLLDCLTSKTPAYNFAND